MSRMTHLPSCTSEGQIEDECSASSGKQMKRRRRRLFWKLLHPSGCRDSSFHHHTFLQHEMMQHGGHCSLLTRHHSNRYEHIEEAPSCIWEGGFFLKNVGCWCF